MVEGLPWEGYVAAQCASPSTNMPGGIWSRGAPEKVCSLEW